MKPNPLPLRVGSTARRRSEKIPPMNCTHLAELPPDVRPNSKGCAECLARGDSWVHLRLCMSCGNVGCCDSSKNKHATKHFHRSKHPIVRSLEPGEEWGWCYVDEVMFESL